MSKVVRKSIYLLAILMPVSTLISQVFTNRFGLPFWSVLWKEVLVAVISIITLHYIFKNIIRNKDNLVEKLREIWPLIAVFVATISVLVSSLVFRPPITNLVFGFRFELFWLWFYGIMVSYLRLSGDKSIFDDKFYSNLRKSIYLGFGIVLVITLFSIVLGQSGVLSFFGFGVGEGNEFVTRAPLAHVIDGGGFNDGIRLSGTFSTPNHFAAYLLLVSGLFLKDFFDTKRKKYLVLLAISLILIVLSFARFSWLGVFGVGMFGLVFLFVENTSLFAAGSKIDNFRVQGLPWDLIPTGTRLRSLWESLSKKLSLKKITRNILLYITLLIPAFIGLVAINLPYENLVDDLPSFIAKPSSTSLHRRHLMASLEIFDREPSRILTGFGLGVSGPGAKEEYGDIYQNPLIRKFGGDIPYKWFLVERDLLIPENWFVQVLINGGLVYLISYLSVILVPIIYLIRYLNSKQIEWGKIVICLSLFTIIIGNLFLHLWENQTVVIYWTIIWMFIFDKKSILGSE